MGLVASQARLLMLHARKSDLEFRMQQITQMLMTITAQTAPIANEFATTIMANENKMNNGDGHVLNMTQQAMDQVNLRYNAKMARAQEWEKHLQLELKNVETQHKAVAAEIESVGKIIDKNIEMTFKYA